MSEETKQCPVCKLENQTVLDAQDLGRKVTYSCNRCGQYTILGTAEGMVQCQDTSAQLSGWLRERNLLRIEIPILTPESVKELASTLPHHGPLEKQKRLLKAIEQLTEYPGKPVVLTPEHDASLAWAQNSEEFSYYLRTLTDRGLLVEAPHKSIDNPAYRMIITAKGWEHLEKDQSNLAATSQVFVAMSFNSQLRNVYSVAIEPAIKATGYEPYRVDYEPHLDRIDAKIIAEIRNSRFVVADVTEQKAGVYYEAGFASGLGLPVIWCVRHDDLGNVHFDTRQYNHVVWESESELKQRLEEFILATIGRKAS